MRNPDQRGSASIWAILVTAGAFTVLLGLVVDGGRAIDARIEASRIAAQAARAGADSLSPASVRDGNDIINVEGAIVRARGYLSSAGLSGSVSVTDRTVTVTVSGSSSNQILSVIGIGSFPIDQSATARSIKLIARFKFVPCSTQE